MISSSSDSGDLPAGIKRAHLISEDHSAIHRTAREVPEHFNIPKDKVEFGADTGPFASIHFSIDVPEEYIPMIWEEAVRRNNVFVKCGCMAIQIGTGPMLWMREHHGPEHTLPGKCLIVHIVGKRLDVEYNLIAIQAFHPRLSCSLGRSRKKTWKVSHMIQCHCDITGSFGSSLYALG